MATTTAKKTAPAAKKSTTGPSASEIAEKDKRDAVVRAGYAHAQKALRDKHLAEFQEFQRAYCKAEGVEWTPPLTKEQKAEADLKKLLEANPGLAAKYGPVDPAVSDEPVAVEG